MMDGEGEPPAPPAERRRRAAIILAAFMIYVAGAHEAWRALRVEAAPYPHAALQQIAGLASTAQPPSRTMLCAAPVRVSVAHFSQQDATAALSGWADAQLQPTLSALRPVVDVQLSTSTVLYTPSASNWVSSAQLSAEQSHAIGWDLAAQLPMLQRAAATVLLLDLPPSWAAAAPLEQRPPRVVHLADDMLLLIGANGTAASPQAARIVLEWLFRGLPSLLASTESEDVSSMARELATVCLQGASHAVDAFLRTVEAQPGAALTAPTAAVAEQVVAAHAAAAAAVTAGSWQPALASSREAYAAAAELASHPDHASDPLFPSEHKLALLLPIALPPLLLLSQAVAKEIKAARRRKLA